MTSFIAPAVLLIAIVTAATIGAAHLDRPRAPAAPTPTHVDRDDGRTSRLGSVWKRRMVWLFGVAVSIAIAGPFLAASVAASVFAARRLHALLTTRSQRLARAAALPDAIDQFVLLVHAGLTPQSAIERLATAAPVALRPAFTAVVHRLRRGAVLTDALTSVVDHVGSPAVPMVELVGSSTRSGVPMADVLMQLSAETRATRRRLDEAAARSLPVKLSFPLVVCTLPSFVLLAIAPAVMAALSSLGDTSW